MTPAQSQAADHFWLGVIALLTLIVLVMLSLVCIWRLVWLVAEARQARRPVSDDPQQEYREVAETDDEIERVVAEFRAEIEARADWRADA